MLTEEELKLADLVNSHYKQHLLGYMESRYGVLLSLPRKKVLFHGVSLVERMPSDTAIRTPGESRLAELAENRSIEVHPGAKHLYCCVVLVSVNNADVPKR